ncbi:MAG: oligosaccharide flippase family protein [Cyclobacteriaceae bacterium]
MGNYGQIVNFIRRSFFSDQEKKTVIRNAFYLLLSQGVNYLIPLVQLPILFRILSIEKIGALNIAQSYSQYFIVLIEFGFNYTATKYVALNRDNRYKLDSIFSGILSIRFILASIGAIVYFPLLGKISQSGEMYFFYIIYFGVVFSYVLNVSWFFQGMQDMKIFTIISTGMKLLILLCIVTLVNSDDEFTKIGIIYSIFYITSALIGFTVAIFRFKIRFNLVKIHELFEFVKDAVVVFLGNVSAMLYTYSNIFLLGVLISETAVGIFVSADKLMKIGQTMFASASIALFPYLSTKFSKSNSRQFVRKLSLFCSIPMVIFTMVLFFGADFLVEVFTGDVNINASTCLKVLSPVPIIVTLSHVFGVQVMLNKGYNKEYLLILVAVALINFIISPILIRTYQYVGLSIATVIVEFIVTISMGFFLYSKKII